MEFTLGKARIPNGTVLVLGIRYEGENMTPEAQAKVWTYAALKAGGLWYLTGNGRVPTAAEWGAVQRWLGNDNRRVVWVKAVTQVQAIWPATEASGYQEPPEVDRVAESLAAWMSDRGSPTDVKTTAQIMSNLSGTANTELIDRLSARELCNAIMRAVRRMVP